MRSPLNRPRSPLAGLATAAIVVTAVTIVLYPISELDTGVSSGVLYVLGVLLVAGYWGLWLGLLTSLAGAICLPTSMPRPLARSTSTLGTPSRSASCS